MTLLFDFEQSLKTLGEFCSAVPPGAVGARREDAAGGVDGQLEVRWVELVPSAVSR
jgi:hypothetical protein